MGGKPAETTHNINNTFGPGTSNKHMVQCWFRKFCKGDESLEDEKCSGQPLEVDNNQFRDIIKADSLTTTEVAQEYNISHWVESFGIWSKFERWKGLLIGALWTDRELKKSLFWRVFSYSTQHQLTIPRLDCSMQRKVDFIWQPATTSSVAGLRSSKALPKAKLAPKKRSRSLFGDLNNYSFLNPRETITFEKYAQQNNEMHQKLKCLQHTLVNKKGPILIHYNTWPHITQPMLHKLNELGYKTLPHPPYSPDLSLTNYHFFKHLDNFLQGKCFHNQHEAENSFQEFIKSQSTDFYATGINKPISHWQKCLL